MLLLAQVNTKLWARTLKLTIEDEKVYFSFKKKRKWKRTKKCLKLKYPYHGKDPNPTRSDDQKSNPSLFQFWDQRIPFSPINVLSELVFIRPDDGHLCFLLLYQLFLGFLCGATLRFGFLHRQATNTLNPSIVRIFVVESGSLVSLFFFMLIDDICSLSSGGFALYVCWGIA